MKYISFDFGDCNLYLNQVFFLETTGKITKVLFVEDLIFLLLEPNHATGQRNVVCYNFSKAYKWAIEPPPDLPGTYGYSSIYFRDDKFCAYTNTGIEVNVDPNTGKIIDSEFIK